MVTIRVFPGREGVAIAHPSAGLVRTNGRGSLWPSDGFTHSRLQDGSISRSSGGGIVNDVGAARRRIIDKAVNPPEDK